MAKSMNLNTASGLSGMLKKGHKTFQGSVLTYFVFSSFMFCVISTFHVGIHGAVLQNIDACRQIADILRTSFGPNGL